MLRLHHASRNVVAMLRLRRASATATAGMLRLHHASRNVVTVRLHRELRNVAATLPHRHLASANVMTAISDARREKMKRPVRCLYGASHHGKNSACAANYDVNSRGNI
jgi:hypothetical protein